MAASDDKCRRVSLTEFDSPASKPPCNPGLKILVKAPVRETKELPALSTFATLLAR